MRGGEVVSRRAHNPKNSWAEQLSATNQISY